MAYGNSGYGNSRSGGGRSSGGYKKSGGGGYNKNGRSGGNGGGYAKRGAKKQQQERHPLETSTISLGEPPFETTMALTGFVNISPELLKVLLANPELFYNAEYNTFQLEVAIWEGDNGRLSGNVRLPFDKEMNREEWEEQLDQWMSELDAPVEVEVPTSKKQQAVSSPAGSKAKSSRAKKSTPETTSSNDEPPVGEVDEYDDIPF